MPFNSFQWGTIHALSWVVCLADGWVIHNHVLFGLGFFLLIYSFWRMTKVAMNTPEDDEFERIEREQSQGWRKRHVVALKTNQESFDEWEHSHQPDQFFLERRAYFAGFEAGARNERLKKEIND